MVETTFIDKKEDFPAELDSHKLAEFLHGSLKPFEDPVPEILSGIEYALSPNDHRGGFIALAREDGVLVGALVMLFTHMEGYVPPNLLLFGEASAALRGCVGTSTVSPQPGHFPFLPVACSLTRIPLPQ